MQYQSIFSVLPTAITALTTYYIARKNIFSQQRLKITNDQLYNVYLPLFKFLEPNLYKKVDITVINDFLDLFNKIKDKHYELIDSNLLNSVFLLENSIQNNTYNFNSYDYLCSVLDKEFEKKRSFLSLPTRSFIYKLNLSQFDSSTKSFFSEIKNEIVKLIPMASIFTLFIIIFMLLTLFINFIKTLI